MRNQNLDVSVIILNYNYGHFLESSIKSVLNQSRKPEFIHLSDDNSTDDSLKVASKFADQISIYSNSNNLGVTEHLNTAIKRTESDLVLILSADDQLAPNAVELLQERFQNEPQLGVAYFDVIVFGDRAHIHSAGSRSLAIAISRKLNSKIFLWKFPDFNSKSFEILKEYNFITGSSMFRREAFDEVGGFRKKYPEDHDFWVRILSNTKFTAEHLKTPLLYYRQHSNVQFNNILAANEKEKSNASTKFSRIFRFFGKLLFEPKRTIGNVRFLAVSRIRRTKLFNYLTTKRLQISGISPSHFKFVEDFEDTQNL